MPKPIEKKPTTSPEKPTEETVEQKPPPQIKSESAQNLISQVYTGVAEKTVEESSYWPQSSLKPYNPDDLYRKTNDYSLYEDMIKDDQISVCRQIKRDLIIGDGWDIVPEVSDDAHEEIARDLTVALSEDPEVPFEESLEEILSGDDFGFSLTEKIFKNRDDGSLTLRALKTRHPSTWVIHTDKHGNVEKYEQRGTQSETLDINPMSLIHYVNKRKFQNPYGESDLRVAYNAWFTKRQVIRYYGIFLEKAASPVPVGRYDTNAPAEAVAKMFEALKKFQAKTALVIPKALEVEFLESKSNGEAYEKAINIFNMFIGRSMMIPDLMGFQGSETGGGSYALGKDQLEIFFKHVSRRRRTIERIVNKEILWPIVVTNYGFVENYPKFKLRPISDAHLVELAKAWLEAVKGKVYKANDEEINHFRSLVKFPEGEVQHDAPVQIGPDGKPLPPGQQPPPGEDGEPTNEDPKEKTEDGQGEKPPSGQQSDKKKKKNFKATPGDYSKKVDFKLIETQMDRFKNEVATEALPVVKRIYEDLYDQMEQRKIIRDAKPERIEALKVKHLSQLKLILKRNFREAFVGAKKIGRSELLKGVFRTPLPDDKFLEHLDSETFQYVGDWSYNVSKRTRVAIMEAIRDGKPLSAVIDLLDQEGMEDSMVSLERFARTKFTDVMNRGRLAAFNDSGVVAAYQYSAILDDRTTEICSGLHGKIFANGSEPIPPMHFNCRSLLVPITKYEAFEADEDVAGVSIDEFIEANKGAGFSRR